MGGQLSARPYGSVPSEDRTSAKRTHDAARRVATVFEKLHCLIRTYLPAGRGKAHGRRLNPYGNFAEVSEQEGKPRCEVVTGKDGDLWQSWAGRRAGVRRGGGVFEGGGQEFEGGGQGLEAGRAGV